MYIPKHFLESDADALAAFIDEHSFGTLVTLADGRPFASHVPFLYEPRERLLHAHVARANPASTHIAAAPEVLVMFQGPHGYISPTWYTQCGVPTWNYTAVHVYGTVRIIDDLDSKERHVKQLAARYERGSPQPWVPSFDPKQLHGIVGLEIRVNAIEGKLKLSQNRSAADRAGVVAALEARGTDNDTALARLVEAAGRKSS
ncbi:MAG TPA: FMN-binding negative transcriptional regulator [Gammaproteobacteria bacterium]|nr:FMN-binding negative transcriptional regulator [Gammaproteobacteria bacterium]